MRRVRIIPVLLLHKGRLVKSIRFRDYHYIGDPINAVKIFNEKEVDELVILDIDASREGRGPKIDQVKNIVSEAFIPVAYGGGITSVDQIRDLLGIGIEKVVINTAAHADPELITSAAQLAGSQSIVVSVDVKKSWTGKYRVHFRNGSINSGEDPVEYCKQMEERGAGELFLNNIDFDGTYKGYDKTLISKITNGLSIPVTVCGGAGSLDDFCEAVSCGASAAAAGSLFVFKRPHRAVLITYPSQSELEKTVYSKVH